jgi:hypothetical protein
VHVNNSPDFAEIADAWIAYYLWVATRPRDDSGARRTLSQFREEDAEAHSHGFWAYEAVDLLVRTEPEKAWSMILRLVELAPDDYVLATVAAGPLENLLGLQPYAFIHRVEDHAGRDQKFRRCLSGVWGWSTIPDDVQLRMRRTWEGEEPL